MPGSATSGLSFQTPLIFEQGSPKRHGASLAADELPAVDAKSAFGDMARVRPPLLPEVSEPEVFATTFD